MAIVTIERRQVSDQVVLLVCGRMDAENAPQFEQQCRACIAEGLTGLVVDLGELRYVSSMGLRGFISVGKTLQDKGGALRVIRHALARREPARLTIQQVGREVSGRLGQKSRVGIRFQ
jgi:anti-anti-sigma factor